MKGQPIKVYSDDSQLRAFDHSEMTDEEVDTVATAVAAWGRA